MKGKKEIVEAIRAAVEAQLTKQGIDAHTWQHDKSFSDVGLDSLDMVAVARTLSSLLGVDLPTTLLFDHPNTEMCATFVAARCKKPGASEESTAGTVFMDTTSTAALLDHISDISPGTYCTLEILGVATRLPGLSEQGGTFARVPALDTITPVPLQRWSTDADATSLVSSAARFASLLPTDCVDAFDPSAFSMGRAEAVHLDPSQRLLLELSSQLLTACHVEDPRRHPGKSAQEASLGTDAHASRHRQRLDSGSGLHMGGGDAPGPASHGLEAWGLGPGTGSAPGQGIYESTGVFVGVSYAEYAGLVATCSGKTTVYTGTGTSLSVNPGRLSFVFGLSGPSLAIDTACSSSLVALATSRVYLNAGQCTDALTGGCNVLLSATTMNMYAIAGMLAPGGRCRTMDASADGYVRAEAAVMLHVAVRRGIGSIDLEGHTTGGAILAARVNQDGRSSSLTAPNGPKQQALIRDALLDASATALEVSALQMHGTGTALGDPIETNAALTALRQGPVGSHIHLLASKAQVGHAEAAAGAVAAVASLQGCSGMAANHNPHMRQINPYVEQPMEACVGTVSLHRQFAPLVAEDSSGRRVHGISAFAFQGTNAHVVLEHWAPEGGCGAAFDSETRHSALIVKERCFVVPQAHCLLRRALPISALPIVSMAVELGTEHAAQMKHHVVQGKILLPGAAMLETCLAGGLLLLDDECTLASLEGASIPFPLEIPSSGEIHCQLMLNTESGLLELRSSSHADDVARGRLHTRAHLRALRDRVARLTVTPERPPLPFAGVLHPRVHGIESVCIAAIDSSALGNSVQDYGVHPSVLDNAVQSGLVYIESGSFVPAAASCFWRPGSAGHDAHRTSYVSATVRPHPTGSGILTDFHVFQGTAPAPGVVLRQLNSKQIRLQDKTAGAASWRHAPFLFAQRLCISSPEGYSGVANDAPTTCRNSWGARGSRDVLSMSTSAAGQPDALHAVEQARARHDTRGGATLASRSTTGALVTAAEALRMFAASGGRETAVSLSARHSGPAPGKAEERVEMEGAIERGIAGMAHAAATEMQKAAFAYPPRSGTDSFISFAPLRAGVSTGGSVLSGDQGPGGGVTVVTGGTGALGALLARAMVRSATPARSYPRDANAAPAGAYRGGILLLGRTGRPRGPESDDLEGLCAGGANVLVGMARCDAAVNSDVELLTGRSGVVAGLWLAVRGVVHAAGLLRDGLTRGLTSGAVREVAAPKVTAMRNLAGSGTSLWGHPLSAAVATSSVSALVGFLGQASYAAANSAMEAGVLASRQAGVPWSAVQLGALAAVGMAARSASGAADVLQRTQSWGLGCLRPLDALSALHSSLLSTQAGAPGGDVTVATPFDFPTVRSRLPAFASRHTFDEAEATVGEDLGDGSAAADVAGDASRDAEGPRADGGEDSHKDVRLVNPAVAAAVIQALKDVTGRAFGVESSLAGVGIGSVRAARLSNRIAQQLGVKVPPTLIFDYPVLSDMIRALEDTLPDGHPMLSACVPPSTDNGPHFQRPSHLGRQATERPSPCALHRTSPGATADGNAIRQQSAPLSLTMPSPHGSRQASHPKRQAQEDLTQGHSSERRRQASIHSEGSWSFPVAVPDLSDEGAADDAMGLARGGSFAGYSAGDPAFCCGLDGFPGAAWDQLSPASSFRGVMRSRITEEPAVHGDVAEDEGHAVIAEIEQDLPSDEAPDASWRSSEAESGVTPEERARGAVEGAVRAVVGADATAATALADGGVDSVSALEIRNKIAEALGVDLPETLLFDYPTAEELIPFVSSLLPRPAPRPASRTAPASRSRPPLHASQATRFGPQTPRSPAAVGPFGGTSPAAPHVAAGKPGARRSLFGGSTSARSSIEMPAVPPRVPSGRPPRHSTPQGSPLRRTLSDLPKAMHEAGGQTPPHRTPPRVPGGPQRSHHRMGPGRRSGATSARASWNEYVGSSGMQGPATWEEKQMMDHVTGGGLGAPGPAPTLALVPMYIPGSAQPVYALQPVQLGAPNGHPRFGGCSSETGHAGWAKTAHPDWLGAGGGADWTDNDEDEYDLLPRRERARTEVMGSENGARPRRLRRSASIFLKESHRSSHASRMSGAESLQGDGPVPPFISSAAPRARHGISVSAQSTPARGQAPRRHAEAQWGAPALESDPDAQTWVTARSRADLSGRTRQSSAISESEAWGVHSGWQEEWSGYLQGTASAQGVPWWESGGLAAASQGPRRPSRQQTYSTQGMLKLRAMVAQASHAERKGKGIHPSNFMGRVEGASAAQASKPKLTAEEIQAKIIAVIKETTGTDIGAGESLLDAGVDSISATEVRDKLKERLAVYLPETLVFDYPTPHDIAQFVMESA